MKKEISIWSFIAFIISLIALCLYSVVIVRDISAIGVLLLWIILSVISPLFPILAKFLRNRKEKHGKKLEIFALIIGSYNLYLIFFCLTTINMYIVFAMIAVICITYAKLFNYLSVKHTSAPTKYSVSNTSLKNNVASFGWQCSCGRVHPKYESSCVCGKSKTEITNLQKSEKTEIYSDVSSETHDQILFCRKCGNKLIKGAFFCGKCGMKVIRE